MTAGQGTVQATLQINKTEVHPQAFVRVDLTILPGFPKQHSFHCPHDECGHTQRPIDPGRVE